MKALVLAALFVAAPCWAGVPAVRDLGAAEWQMRVIPGAQANAHRNAAVWQRARVPGSVHTDLLANGVIADPYVGAREAELQWIGLADWEYRTRFDVDAATLARAHNDLVFDGLDTFADVFLNGHKLASTDNMFRTWRLPVHGRLKPAGNELRVVFHSPIQHVLAQVQAMPHKLPANYDWGFGDEPKGVLTQNFVRKAGYQYGWDWGPRYVTAGIWKPVRLESRDTLRIADLHIAQDRIDADAAALTAQIDIESDLDDTVTLDLHYARSGLADGQTLTKRVMLQRGTNRIDVPLRIDHPQLWFPIGYGAQPLYVFSVAVADAHGVQAEASRRTGLRRVELLHERDDKGRGFAFAVNGVPVFAKGANLIPFDMFPARATRAQQLRVLESARDAHMNLLRSWGGGYYESDEFFDLADEMGILVWQDFMFGGGATPAYDPGFRANVLAEAREQVRRLRDHPSLVLWCGNNEVEAGWLNWGWKKKLENASPAFAAKAWAGYMQLFGHDLRAVVAENGGGVPYWSSSPSNDLDGKPDVDDTGDRHYWEVWGGPAKPVDAYLDVTPRFMSEYGLQAWPSLRTIATIAKPDEMQIDSPVIRAHQKFLYGDGNTRLLKYVREYGEPKDFADFVYLSQVAQAEGIELAALHHRASRPRTMGTLYWQLNDVWPGASWSSIDWYGRWKALQFHARRFYADVAVAALRNRGETRVSLINDLQQPLAAELRLRVFDFDGKLLREETKPVTLGAAGVTQFGDFADADLLRGAAAKRTLAVFELRDGDATISRGVVYFDAAKNLDLPDPGLHADIAADGEAFRITLTAQKLARALWLDFGDLDVELSDNALTLLPGESIVLRLQSKAALADLREHLTLRTLAMP